MRNVGNRRPLRMRLKREALYLLGLAVCLFCTGCSKNLKTFLIAAGALLIGHLIFRGGVARGRQQVSTDPAKGAGPAAKVEAPAKPELNLTPKGTEALKAVKANVQARQPDSKGMPGTPAKP